MARMVKIDELIAELTETRQQFGNTCVWIEGLSWGAVALNRQADAAKRETHRGCGCAYAEGPCICDDPDFA